MEKHYQMDIVVNDIILELKSVDELNSAHRAQLFNYLRLTKKPIGLLINFGQESLQGERYAYNEETNECILLDKNMEPFYK
jgi:GxxExxY protein